MQKWGKTSSGKQRYRCKQCRSTGLRARSDNSIRVNQGVFVRWLTGSERLVATAKRMKTTIRTLNNRFADYWDYLPQPSPIEINPKIIVVDAVSVVKRKLVALIAQNPLTRKPLGWNFADRECFDSWIYLFNSLATQGIYPEFVVCDGQRGLLKAILTVWPKARIQRCLIHVMRQAKLWLTQQPKTKAGQALLILVKQLPTIHTRRQKRKWVRAYRKWLKKHKDFLKERSYSSANPKRWWYTHRKLRAVKSLLSNSLEQLFTFVRYPEAPRTSNHIEGGINSRLKDLRRIHRGLSAYRKQILFAWYLAIRQGQKPTRNFH